MPLFLDRFRSDRKPSPPSGKLISRSMAGARETQHIGGFEAIVNVNWPETQELFNAARRCLDRIHSELNNPDILAHEPSNQDIASLLRYLAQKALDVTPHNTQQSIYAPSHQNSADITAAWLNAPASPWNPLCGIRSAVKAVPTSTTVGPGLSNSFPPLGCKPKNSTNHETHQPQPTLRPEPQNWNVLNSSALAQTQLLNHGTNSLTYQPTNAPHKNGRSSIALSNDTSQLDFPCTWSRESQKTSITTPPFHATPTRRSHQTVAAGVGPLSTSSKSLEDDCSYSVTHEQVGSSAVGPGNRRERSLTYAEAARSNPEQVQEIPVSPATTTGGKIPKNKFRCGLEGCNRTFEWEWKFK